jgi:hypothetical protein
VVVQLDFSTRLLDGVQLKEVDRSLLDLGIGCAWGPRQGTRWGFSFHEDLIAESGHDFLALLRVSRGL